MGVLPGLEVDVNQSITYSFQVSSVVCKFWRKNQWNSYGCTAKAHSEDVGIHCQCEHISTFAAAFSVPPLKVDHFADIDLFLTVQNNPLVLCIIIFLIVLYLLLGVLLWYLDRRDKKFTTVIVLDDNMPGNRYPYLLAVYTSSRLNAGTTAHVGLKLIGTLGSSHIHILTKENAKVLRRNSDDWFLLYCAEPLGLLDSIHIWHDNHGSSPEWYCDKIHVFDLKVGIETIFIVAQWMALSLKYYPEAMYNPTYEEELLGEAFIFGPIKIALVAIVLASASQRLYDLDTHTVDYKKARRVRIPRDEKYLIDLITKRQQAMYTPLSYEMRLTMFMKKVSRHNWFNLLDFITTTCFVFAISLVISRLWVSYYDINSQVQKLLTLSHLPFMGAVDFFKITSVNEMENYLEYSLESALYNNRWYNDFEIVKEGTTNDTRGGHEMDRSYWTADLSNKVLGLPQLRQFRVIPIDCTLIGDGHDKCIPGLTEKYRDTATYEVGWKLAPWSESERKNSPWIFTEDDYNSQFLLFRLYGESGKLYERGGYSVTLGPARSDADAVIVELREHKWQDKLTRVVFVELTLYNINLDVISQITLIVEHVETGNILLRAMVLTVEHYWIFNNEWRLRKMQRMERQGPRSLGPGFICVDVYTVVSGKGGEIRGRSPIRRRGDRRRLWRCRAVETGTVELVRFSY
ncbi:polycystic kidney disease protein 1-like 2 [Homalodisca vitripennis]|uniref:polycystic kidney disease protein 1-like 2 n=1 Tax=Homalodisca vitripennis TaxID=197043 RepID=UPI001EE9DE41|nr:polycystic kidney disease protein 1-like 2 [Homalodisca vitripennis]